MSSERSGGPGGGHTGPAPSEEAEDEVCAFHLLVAERRIPLDRLGRCPRCVDAPTDEDNYPDDDDDTYLGDDYL
ncbi:hypothetical protein CFC35_23320 [Streptomyces sp. FBKL.4005]|uniref:hypothetical protein n=1 Tax=Streptomyces sp. FBKL.4005 TaxID=2015515 RepID=UPI000B96A76C|nr:hypothetical protein [Streptomyces sp. FBKL.4005]OYP17076.1 hypothetical protein CFC35_23320 [Streptomyces sp. FBKL.4005]